MTDSSLWTLNSLHEQNGATLHADSRGELRASQFTDWKKESDAFGTSAVLFDLSGRSQFRMTGGDRLQFLNGFCTNDIKKLAVGQGCEAFVTSIKSRALGHVFVSRREDDLWIDSATATEDSLIAHLDRYLITDDVELIPETANYGDLLLTGPDAKNYLDGLVGEGSISEQLTNEYDHITVDGSFGSLLIRVVNWLGQPGYLLGVERSKSESVWKHFLEKHVTPAGWKTFETLRIENRFPDYGQDISDENLVQEVGRDKLAISFQKGCYLGQEPIARLDAMGHVNRILCKVKMILTESTDPQTLRRADLFADDKKQGQLTSLAASLDGKTGSYIGLGYVRSDYAKPGTRLTVGENGSNEMTVEVA